MKLKTQLLLGTMTAAERQMGRYMRAPDGHDGGGEGAGGEGASSAPASEQQGEALTTEQQLEKDFGYNPAYEDGEGEEEGEDFGTSAEGDDSDNSGDEGADEGEEGDGADEPDGKKPNRTQERIDELTNQTREADRRAAEATREAEKWRRIAEGAPAPAASVAEGEKDPNAAPNPADYPFGVADPEYIADNATFKAIDSMRKTGEEARVKADLNALEASYQSRIPAALEKYPDFDLKVIKGAEGDTPAWACPPIVAIGIRASEVGTDIAYHLATNPDEAARIASLNNIEQAREFGRLEGRFEYEASLETKATADGEDTPPAPAQRSKAPTPPKKQVRGSGGQFKVPPDTDDFAAFDKAYG
jgi:hypothetical protein